MSCPRRWWLRNAAFTTATHLAAAWDVLQPALIEFGHIAAAASQAAWEEVLRARAAGAAEGASQHAPSRLPTAPPDEWQREDEASGVEVCVEVGEEGGEEGGEEAGDRLHILERTDEAPDRDEAPDSTMGESGREHAEAISGSTEMPHAEPPDLAAQQHIDLHTSSATSLPSVALPVDDEAAASKAASPLHHAAGAAAAGGGGGDLLGDVEQDESARVHEEHIRRIAGLSAGGSGDPALEEAAIKVVMAAMLETHSGAIEGDSELVEEREQQEHERAEDASSGIGGGA